MFPFGERSESKASRLHRKTCLAPSRLGALGGRWGVLKKTKGEKRRATSPANLALPFCPY
jgi:hypothetical protein